MNEANHLRQQRSKQLFNCPPSTALRNIFIGIFSSAILKTPESPRANLNFKKTKKKNL